MSKTRRLSLLAVVLVASACTVDEAEPTVASEENVIERVGEPEAREPGTGVVWENDGEVCLFGPAGDDKFPGGNTDQFFTEGEPLRIRVAVPECLSTSCDVNRTAQCNITAKGDVLIVESYFSYDALDEELCTLDCGRLFAYCESEPLSAGHYEIVHGSVSRALTVPSVTLACGQQKCEIDDDCASGYCDAVSEICLPYE